MGSAVTVARWEFSPATSGSPVYLSMTLNGTQAAIDRMRVAALEQISGRRPVGTRSTHTAALLRKYGYIYISEGSAGQLPHYVFDENGENCLLNLPFHYVIDDAMYSALRGSGARTRRSASPTRNAPAISGGRRSGSNIARAAISTSACTRSSPGGRCASQCSIG